MPEIKVSKLVQSRIALAKRANLSHIQALFSHVYSTESHNTSLYFASSDLEVRKILMANPGIDSGTCKVALSMASSSGNFDVVRNLLKYNQDDFALLDNISITLAYEKKNFAMVELFLKSKSFSAVVMEEEDSDMKKIKLEYYTAKNPDLLFSALALFPNAQVQEEYKKRL